MQGEKDPEHSNVGVRVQEEKDPEHRNVGVRVQGEKDTVGHSNVQSPVEMRPSWPVV